MDNLLNQDLDKRHARIFAKIPTLLKKRLHEVAAKSGRSLTSEMVLRLAHSIDTVEYIHSIPEWIKHKEITA